LDFPYFEKIYFCQLFITVYDEDQTPASVAWWFAEIIAFNLRDAAEIFDVLQFTAGLFGIFYSLILYTVDIQLLFPQHYPLFESSQRV